LERVKHRVVTMHASDRYLSRGHDRGSTARRDGRRGLREATAARDHRQGLNDYDAISELRAVGFDGWVSIEDGVDGMEQLAESVRFVRAKLRQHWAHV